MPFNISIGIAMKSTKWRKNMSCRTLKIDNARDQKGLYCWFYATANVGKKKLMPDSTRDP